MDELIKKLNELKSTLQNEGFKEWSYSILTLDEAIAVMKNCNIPHVSNWRFIKNNEENLKSMPKDRDFDVLFDTCEVCKYSEDFPFAEIIAWR